MLEGVVPPFPTYDSALKAYLNVLLRAKDRNVNDCVDCATACNDGIPNHPGIGGSVK